MDNTGIGRFRRTQSRFVSVQKKVGNYLLKEQLGQGGQATVYLCLNMKEDFKPYAIKRFMKDVMAEEDKLDTVKTEVFLMQKINHLNILRAFEVLETNNSFYIILEYCKKKSLEAFIKNGPLPEQRAVFFLQQIMNGLQELKKHKILHRDIKLGNLLVTDDNIVKIADFGFSIMGEHSKTYVGTISHMAPEIIFKGNDRENIYYDYKADLWSTGVVFYELLHRKRPFAGNDKDEIQANIKKYSGANLQFGESVSPEAKDLLIGLLTENPDKRFDWKQFYGHKIFQKYESLRIDSDLKQSIMMNFKNTTSVINPKVELDYININDKKQIQQMNKSKALKIDENSEFNSTSNLNGEDKNVILADFLRELGHVYLHEQNKFQFLLLTVQKICFFNEKFNYHGLFFHYANIIHLILKLVHFYNSKILKSIDARENYLEINPVAFNFIVKEEMDNKNQMVYNKFVSIKQKFLRTDFLIQAYFKVVEQFSRQKNVCLVYQNTANNLGLNELQIFAFLKNEFKELGHYKNKGPMKKNTEMLRAFLRVNLLIRNVMEMNERFPYFVDPKVMMKFDWRTFRNEIDILDLKATEFLVKSEKNFMSVSQTDMNLAQKRVAMSLFI